MKTIWRIKNIILTLSTFLLCSCGFHLQNANSLPPELHTIYLQPSNQYGEFEASLQRALKSSGVVLVTNAEKAKLRLYLTSAYTYSTTSPGTSNQARVYALSYTASIYAVNAKGKTVLPLKTAITTRSVSLAPNEIYESSNQIIIVKHELQQELINKIFYILSSPQTFRELAASQ